MKHVMTRQLFIVARERDDLFRTLCSALRDELDVEILFDRRKGAALIRPHGEERRTRFDVDERIRTDGYAVVRLSADSGGNVRWS